MYERQNMDELKIRKHGLTIAHRLHRQEHNKRDMQKVSLGVMRTC